MIKEGVVRAYVHHNNQVVDTVAMHVAFDCPSTMDELLSSSLLTDESVSVKQFVEQQRKKFGKDINIIRYD